MDLKFFFIKLEYFSFIIQLEVQVISCENSTFKPPNGKAVKGFDVVFSDTVLFPEGGGQVRKFSDIIYHFRKDNTNSNFKIE